MSNEDKVLLLKDLACRIPYNVKVSYQVGDNFPKVEFFNAEQYQYLKGSHWIDDWLNCTFKPCLIPMSKMTEEQKIIYDELINAISLTNISNIQKCVNELYDWLNQNHFDYRGLIPMDLAIDATILRMY